MALLRQSCDCWDVLQMYLKKGRSKAWNIRSLQYFLLHQCPTVCIIQVQRLYLTIYFLTFYALWILGYKTHWFSSFSGVFFRKSVSGVFCVCFFFLLDPQAWSSTSLELHRTDAHSLTINLPGWEGSLMGELIFHCAPIWGEGRFFINGTLIWWLICT